MSNFLDRLKKKDLLPTTPEDAKKTQVAAQTTASVQANPAPSAPAEQLKVDIHQTQNAIIIFAQIAGANVNDYSVMIEGDGDVVTIKGQRNKPNVELFEHPGLESKEQVLSECSWGKFYRQIILPAAVEASKTQAKFREGVLMLLLPLKETSDSGVRIQVQSL
jgi:HSP20 family molecular chaperone IbpA